MDRGISSGARRIDTGLNSWPVSYANSDPGLRNRGLAFRGDIIHGHESVRVTNTEVDIPN